MRRALLICLLLVLVLHPNNRASAGAAHSEPLTYIGPDGNIYMMDGHSGASTVITNATKEHRLYKNIRWSPDGRRFLAAFRSDLDATTNEQGFILAESGQTPRAVNPEIPIADSDMPLLAL